MNDKKTNHREYALDHVRITKNNLGELLNFWARGQLQLEADVREKIYALKDDLTKMLLSKV